MERHFCGICRKSLQGRSSKGPKSKKKVLRAFPELCVRCSERVFRLSKRLSKGEIKEIDVELRYLYYVNLMRDKI